MQTDLSIIIPSYNEINFIEKFSLKLGKDFEKIDAKFIFVDDGSTDGTKEWIKENISKIFFNKKFEIIDLKRNKGKGAAIREGILFAEGTYIMLIDSDMEYNPIDALEMYKILIDNISIDVFFGSRYMGGKIQYRIHYFHDLAVRLNTFIFNFLFGQSITDLHSGTKIFKKEILNNINLSVNGFGFEIDLSTQIAKNKFKIYEYGISYFERTKEEGKKITLIDGFLSYYYLFKSRFIDNDIQTILSMFYAAVFMVYTASYFGMGIGKYMLIFFFFLLGMLMGTKYKLIALSNIFLSIYVGSLFGSGNGKIYTVLLGFMIGIYNVRFINKYFKKKFRSYFTSFLI